MGNKTLLTWNVRPGKDREHFQQIRVFVRKLSTIGLELEDAWYTIYGGAPQILIGIVTQEKGEEQLESALKSEEWQEILAELAQYITDYRQRIVNRTDHFQF